MQPKSSTIASLRMVQLEKRIVLGWIGDQSFFNWSYLLLQMGVLEAWQLSLLESWECGRNSFEIMM